MFGLIAARVPGARELKPMTPITVRSTINLQDKVSNVSMAMMVGFANFSSGTISVKPKDGTLTTPFPQVAANAKYALGPATNLISNGVRTILTGDVGDPNGPVQGSYSVTCVFYQNGLQVGTSGPVQGKYGVGQARQDFNIICNFT